MRDTSEPGEEDLHAQGSDSREGRPGDPAEDAAQIVRNCKARPGSGATLHREVRDVVAHLLFGRLGERDAAT